MFTFTRVLSAACVVCLGTTPILAAGYGSGGGGTATADPAAADSMMHSMAMGTAKLTTPGGMSLYVFAKDEAGKSNCYGDCAKEWPPMLALASATVSENFSMITRSNGSKQWAYMGQPLYMFDEDKIAGDVNGADYSPDWHLATAAQ